MMEERGEKSSSDEQPWTEVRLRVSGDYPDDWSLTCWNECVWIWCVRTCNISESCSGGVKLRYLNTPEFSAYLRDARIWVILDYPLPDGVLSCAATLLCTLPCLLATIWLLVCFAETFVKPCGLYHEEAKRLWGMPLVALWWRGHLTSSRRQLSYLRQEESESLKDYADRASQK